MNKEYRKGGSGAFLGAKLLEIGAKVLQAVDYFAFGLFGLSDDSEKLLPFSLELPHRCLNFLPSFA